MPQPAAEIVDRDPVHQQMAGPSAAGSARWLRPVGLSWGLFGVLSCDQDTSFETLSYREPRLSGLRGGPSYGGRGGVRQKCPICRIPQRSQTDWRLLQSTPASMGPRPFRRGNIPIMTDSGRYHAWLQWGLALSGGEPQRHQLGRRRVERASMGPRPFRRGNSLHTSHHLKYRGLLVRFTQHRSPSRSSPCLHIITRPKSASKNASAASYTVPPPDLPHLV